MKRIRFSIPFVIMAMVACDPAADEQKQIKNTVWASHQERLKAPSTARLVSMEIKELTDEKTVLSYYLNAQDSIKELGASISKLEEHNMLADHDLFWVKHNDPGMYNTISEQLPKIESKKDKIAFVRKMLDELKFVYTPKCKTQKTQLFHAAYDYDAQNSFGTYLRGHGSAVVLKTIGYSANYRIVLQGDI